MTTSFFHAHSRAKTNQVSWSPWTLGEHPLPLERKLKRLSITQGVKATASSGHLSLLQKPNKSQLSPKSGIHPSSSTVFRVQFLSDLFEGYVRTCKFQLKYINFRSKSVHRSYSDVHQALIHTVLHLYLVIFIVGITLFFVMKKNTSRKGLEVFEFDEEDELIESSAKKYAGKFGNPKSDNSPLTKYTFLQCFAGGMNHQKVETSKVSCIDVDSSNSDHKCKNHQLRTLKGITAATEVISAVDEVLVSNSIHDEPHAVTRANDANSKNPVPRELKVYSRKIEALSLGLPLADKEQSNCILPELPSENDLVDVISDDDKSVEASSLLTPDDIDENEGSFEDSASDHYSSGSERENIDLAVSVSPDHLEYGDNYCTKSVLTFSCNGIKLEGRNAYGDKESFSSEWAIAEITSIETQWFARVETALIKLYMSSGAEIDHENLDGTSGILKVKFAVFDPCWSGKQKKIMSMDAKYNAIWKVVLDTDSRDDGFNDKNLIYSSKAYFPNFDQPFEDVIYPKGDPDAVSISKRDVELLQPETFINDTIIDFYIKYLKNKIQPEDRQRFHFFNSFFFRKLADLDKDPSSASQGRAAFQRVRKWTRKVNLFEKDYIFIPVNFNLHWSLIVICHPGEVSTFEGEDGKKSLKVPCILHMDSIKGSHKGLKNLVQSYLWEEWKERKTESSEEVSSKFLNLRFVSLEVPQQENSFDCGLFLLHYVELFLEDGPVCFNPFKITKFSNFLNRDWFPPAEASLKRAFIQKIIYDLLEDPYQKKAADFRKDEHKFSGFTEIENGKENRVELLSENHMQAKACHGNTSCSTSSQGIEIGLLTTSTGAAHCFRDSGFGELLDQGTTEGPISNGQYGLSDQLEPFHGFKSAASSMQEDRDIGNKLALSPSGGAGVQAPEGITTGSCSTSFSTKGLGIFDSLWNPRLSILDEEQEAEDASTNSSSFDSQCPSRIGMDEPLPTGDSSGIDTDELPTGDSLHSGKKLETEKPRSVSPENVCCITGSPASVSSSEGLETCIVKDSQEEDTMAESKENKESGPFCAENIAGLAQKDVDFDENKNLELSGDDPTSESDEQQASKRLRRAAHCPSPSSVPKDHHS